MGSTVPEEEARVGSSSPFFFLLVLGPHLVMLRGYSWFCSQEPQVSGMRGMGPGSACGLLSVTLASRWPPHLPSSSLPPPGRAEKQTVREASPTCTRAGRDTERPALRAVLGCANSALCLGRAWHHFNLLPF